MRNDRNGSRIPISCSVRAMGDGGDHVDLSRSEYFRVDMGLMYMVLLCAR